MIYLKKPKPFSYSGWDVIVLYLLWQFKRPRLAAIPIHGAKAKIVKQHVIDKAKIYRLVLTSLTPTQKK